MHNQMNTVNKLTDKRLIHQLRECSLYITSQTLNQLISIK